jgi:hypothetical protein
MEINVIDVGCRYGIHPTWEGIPLMNYYGFDADSKEIVRLKKKYKKKSSNYKFFPIGISDKEGTSKFYTYHHEGQSSYFYPNKKSVWFSGIRTEESQITKTNMIATTTIQTSPQSFKKINRWWYSNRIFNKRF